MVLRRILQKKAWISSSSARSIACSYNPKHAVPSSPIASSSVQKNISILGFPSPPIILQVINSSCITNKCSFSNQAWIDPPLGGIIEVPLAQTGEGIAECELLKWFVQEGDQIEEFQPLCEVQSDKATIEITSRYKGKVSEILYDPGDIVKVGETLLKLVSEESQASTLISDDSNNTVSLSSGTCDTSNKNFLLDEHSGGGSTPAVRHLAKQYGININDIHGTGKDERVLKDDVLNYAANKGMGMEPSASSQASSVGLFLTEEDKYSQTLAVDGWQFEDKTMPLRGFQRAMVKSMTLAAKVPHFHYVEEINCDALVELKASFQHENSDPNVKHTYLPFLIKSLSAALIKHPLLNSSFNEDLNEVILKGSHNIGVAMATPYGLVVPNIKKVQSLSILEITKELSRLQQLALNNKLSSQDISGGTITLSNIGAIGGKFGSPLLNLPEVAIIAVGRIEKLPRFADDGSMYPASITSVNIGADHRVVDGATVARFCNDWKLLIENPEMLMLHMR